MNIKTKILLEKYIIKDCSSIVDDYFKSIDVRIDYDLVRESKFPEGNDFWVNIEKLFWFYFVEPNGTEFSEIRELIGDFRNDDDGDKDQWIDDMDNFIQEFINRALEENRIQEATKILLAALYDSSRYIFDNMKVFNTILPLLQKAGVQSPTGKISLQMVLELFRYGPPTVISNSNLEDLDEKWIERWGEEWAEKNEDLYVDLRTINYLNEKHHIFINDTTGVYRQTGKILTCGYLHTIEY